MKNVYLFSFFPYSISKLIRLVFLFIILISSIFYNKEAKAQLCSAPPISPGTHVSVDPPTFRWYVAIAGSCGPVLLGATTECPINSNFPPPAFGSFPLTDTCFLMSNGQWNSTFSLNTQYCWGSHVINGGFIWQTGGFPIIRLTAVLPPVSLIFPSNADTQISITPRIIWSRIDSANSYTLRVYSDACCITAVFDSTSASDAITVPLGRLSGNSRYYYRVKSYKAGGEGPFSDPFYFTTWTGQLPNLISPSNNSAGVQLTPLLDWEDVLNSLEYRVQVSTDINFSSIIVDNSGLAFSQYNVPGGTLTYNSVYYWRAASRTAAGWSPFSKGWNFKTFSTPDPVILGYPVNNAIELPTSLTFSWYRANETLLRAKVLKNKNSKEISTSAGLIGNPKEIDAINKYWLELTTDTVTLANLVTDNNITDTSKFVSGLSTAKNYYWRVKANNELGWGPFSNWWKFTTVIGPPQAPERISPQNNSFQQFLNLPFIWNRSVEITAKPINGYNNNLFNNKSKGQSGDAISAYWFELTEDTVSLSGLVRDTTLTDTTKLVNLSVNSKSYFWRIKAKNDIGWGAFSNWWKFMTLPAEYEWSLAATNISTNLTSISFVDQWYGWATNNNLIYKTSDGGSNWYVVSNELGMTANAICFTDQNNGRVASRGGGSWNYPWWSTGNGGVNWFPMLYTDYQNSNFVSIAQTPEGIWLVGTLTAQGSFQTYPAIISAGTNHLLTHNIGLNRVRGGKNNAWIVGGQGLIYRSLTQLYVGEDVNLTGVSFNDDNTGYVVGGSKIFKSTNNGSNWFRLYPLTDQTTYNDVFFANKDTGWVACSLAGEGVIIGTTNGGGSWELQYKGTYAGSEFTFTEKKYGWLLCGNSVLRTTNVAGQQNPPPVLMLPANGATAQSLTPQLDWQDALNSVNYKVQLSADSLFTGLIIDDSTLTSSSYVVQTGILQNYTQYYWRVASKNTSSWSEFSTRFSFRTFGIPNNVVLNYPPNNATGISTSLTFNWFTALPTKKTDKQAVSEKENSLRDAAGKLSIGNYWFEFTRDTINLTDLVTDSLLTDTAKTMSGLIFSNAYYWRVKAKNEAGWGAFSPWWKFTTTNGAPVLLQPVHNQMEVPVTPLLNWSDVDGALKFRVQVSAFSNFSVLWLDDSTSAISQLQVSNGILAYNSLYYWRVKTRNLAGWGEYQTPIRFFTQIFPPPPVPVLSSPSNGTSGVELTPLLNWNDVSGSTKYRVQVSLSSDFSTTLVDDSSMIASEYIVPNGILNSNTQYFWKAAVKGVSSWSAFSLHWSFNTIGVPQPVTLFNPINNATGQELNINFTWFKASELLSSVSLNRTQEIKTSESKKIISEKPSLSGVDAINLYQFEITTDTVTFSWLVVDSTLTDTSIFISGLIANTSYYWRVRAGNEIGWGPFSTWWKLTTSSGLPPVPPNFIYPLNNAQNITVTPQLDWSDVTGALKYRVQVSAFSNFSVLWIDDSNLYASNYQVNSGVLAYNSVYYWRIKAKNDAGWGTYQATPFRFFTLIFPPPAVPVLLSPANGASGVLLTPLLDWNNVSGSIKYRVQVSAVPDFSSVLIDDSSLVNSEFNIPVGLLNSGSVYYWKASARSTASWGDFSAPWSFTTLGLPLPVVLSNPGNNSIEQPLNITFTWLIANESLNKLNKKNNTQNNKSSIFGISNKDGSDAINSYWFEMTTDTVSFAGLVRDTALTDTTKIINGLSSLTGYYWRVRAGNEIGWGPFSTWWKLTTSSGLPPAPPNFIYPLNNAQNITVTPQLDWSDVTGALKYRVQVSAFSNFSVLWIDDSNLTASNYQVNSGVLAYNSVYYWRIKAKNDAGWGIYQSSLFRFFTMIIPPPAIPVLVTPFNGSTGISLTPLLDWNDVNGKVKYRLQIAADTGFTNIITDDSALVSSQYNVLAGLLANSTVYYWKVAAKNSFYWSAFSEKFNFTTFGSPQIVTLLSPANNSIEQPLNITFTWMKAIESMKRRESEPKLNAAYTGNVLFNEKTGVDAISKYWFEIVTDTVTMIGLISDTTLTDTTKSVSGLTALTNYFWRVKAFNEVGWGPFSMWWKLTTISGLPPAPPAFIYPLNNAQNITVTPQLDWSDVSGALKYRVQVSAFSNFSVLWIDDSSSVTSYFQVLNGILAYNSVYYWRVKAKNDAGWGVYQVSPIRFFTLITPPPAPPVLLSPENGAVNIPLNTLLDWNDISSALKYRLQVSTANTFVANIIDDSSLSASQYNISSGMLGYNTVYYWRVSVKTGSVWSSFSNAWSFTTVTALISPVLKTPLSKDTGVAVTTLFNWLNVSGATSYRLQVSAFSNFSVLWIDKYVTDTLYQTPNGVLAYNSRYFWKVKALRAGDSSSFSNPNYFFTKIFPYNDNLPEFEESKLLDLSGLMSNYTKTDHSIEISKDTMFDVLSVKLDHLKGEKQELRLDMFDEYSTYYWRVYTSGAKQQYSATNVFVTYITKQHLLMNLRGNSAIPEKYALYQNYPNPFNPVCKIRFDIPKIGNLKTDFVKLVIYDLIGREIAVLVNDNFDPGIYEVTWNATNHSSGIYIYQIKTSVFTDTKKMVLLK